MDGHTLDLAISALALMVEPGRIAALGTGVLAGLAIGVIPGLGGVVGMALLIPFTYGMDPYAAFGFLIGMGSVTTTSDTIPAVLFGVPGTVGASATVMDGHPLAIRGQAGRAFGAAYTASLLGGLAGALLLGVSIPVLKPVILYLRSPDLLAICVFALSMVATLSGRAPLRGMTAAGLGVLAAMVGSDPQTGTLRWTFDTLYLWDGIPLVPLTLGLFAIPELADMVAARRGVPERAPDGSRNGPLTGIADTLRHRWLVLRCGWLGAVLGAIPGLGSAAIDWLAYGHAIRTERGTEGFGQGDIRGVIAPESASNAKEGGALVPTLAFGVPGSASMAILLGAFAMHGLVPGPRMLSEDLDVTYAIVWSIALANVLGSGLCLLLGGQLARIARVRTGTLVPIVTAIVLIGAFQSSRQWGDLEVLLGAGVVGWAMKRLDWPRPPLILGFVLGGAIERYLFISAARYGSDWITQPVVVLCFALAAAGLAAPLVRNLRTADRRFAAAAATPRALPGMLFSVAVIGVLGAAVATAGAWPFAARIAPQAVAVAALACIVPSLALEAFARIRHPAPATVDGHGRDAATGGVSGPRTGLLGSGGYLLCCGGYLLLAPLVGILPGIALFTALLMHLWGREPLVRSLIAGAGVGGGSWLLFDRLLDVPWPASLLGTWLAALLANLR